MKIAATYDNGNIFQHFGKTEFFKVYEVEDNKVISSEVISSNGTGHGALAGLLAEQGISVLICGGIGGGAQSALAEAGIELCSGAQGDADTAVDAYLKGFDGFDKREAYRAIKESSTVSHRNSAWEVYDKYGYYPFDLVTAESVSKTLESAYDDYCVARMAEKLDAKGDYEYFIRRSEYYNYYSYKTWGAAATYHLCIDSSSLGIEETVRFVEEFVA